MTGFAELGLSQGVLEAIDALDYREPMPIQIEAIPVIMRGRDIIGQAQTGSGKTAAFGLPAVEQIDEASEDIQVLVLTPTRELCIQVAQALRTFSEFKGVKVVACFGGQPIPEQTVQLRQGPQIVVGTPGRVMDLIRRGWLQLSDTRYVVLDEADEMLSLGFMEDVEWILKKTPSGRQTLLFSATMPAPIRKLADRYLYEPVHVKVESATLTVETIDQVIVEVEPNRKLDVLCAVLERDRPAAAIVFRRRKMTVDELVAQLGARGFDAAPLHGDMPQGRRDGVMLRFRSGRARLLVATNVAARGLDISHVSHVFSYDVPDDPEEYTHRIGRTGRVGRNGIAYTFMTNRDRKGVAEIERVTGATVRHFTADQVIAGEELKVLPPETVAAVTDAAAEAAPEIEIALPGRVTESVPAVHEPAAVANGAARANGSGHADGEPLTRLFVNAGKRHGVTRDALAEAFTATGIEPRRVRMHHTYGLVDVPADRAHDAVQALTGSDLAGRTLNVELAREQPAAA
jgi:ATP-dependent RNA helicase DeaD